MHVDHKGKMSDIVSFFYPENGAGGFSRCDGTVQFYQRVRALLRPDYVVLDFGAGRGAAYYQDSSLYRKSLRNLRGEGRRIIGVDVDPVVSSNPLIDEGVVIDPASPLPFPNDTFDLIVSDSTFEHVSDAKRVASELDRVLMVGGKKTAYLPAATSEARDAARRISSKSARVVDVRPVLAFTRPVTIKAMPADVAVLQAGSVRSWLESQPRAFTPQQAYEIVLIADQHDTWA